MNELLTVVGAYAIGRVAGAILWALWHRYDRGY